MQNNHPDTFRIDYKTRELTNHPSHLFELKKLITDLKGILQQGYGDKIDIKSASNEVSNATITATIKLDTPLKIRMMVERFELDQATGMPPVINPNANNANEIFIDDMVGLIIIKESGNKPDFNKLVDYILDSIRELYYRKSEGGRRMRRMRRMRRTKTRAQRGKKRATRRRRV